jgi:hypothetical protein
MKKCKKCEITKDFIFFDKRSDSKDGYRNECKECRKILSNILERSEKWKKYYNKNRSYLLDKAKKEKLRKRNIEGKRIKRKIMEKSINELQKVCSKCYNISNKEEFTTDRSKKDGLSSQCNICKNKYFSERKKTDINFKITSYLRSSLSESVSKNKLVKIYKTMDILGCSMDEFKKYIQDKFKDGMCWENYGIWHLDHIIPISYAFNENDLYRLSHFSNFQPLWNVDNLKKGNRYVG